MFADSVYLLAADLILIGHILFVAFVVFGLVAIYLGLIWAWPWVRSFWFRVLHLAAILFVMLQSWVGEICPLTTWEMQLRARGGGEAYDGSFIQHWLQMLLYYEAPEWVFIACYTAFAALVIASWFLVPPKR
ncbi:DUF2784 domain-containing protein [Motiliproteus coralliicola]|uniref:DUF2784 domain-containing protein n=1 Tax=Motiliproteus coralliicola TaxID=2283196 RepID=A0A369WKH1_9GAMM|nr:DUF2784 domain-containing protein [Motiliproteus coralliicola]RDE19955.1 DUF2784 domain-containing protein [Motiliproteus coralliicola]